MNTLPRYVSMAERVGLTVERTASGKHWKLYVLASDGRRGVFSVSRSGSDHRGDKNKLAQLKAFAEGRR